MGMSYRGSFRSLGSRVPVHFRSFADFRIVYRDYSVTHFRVPVCGQPFLVHGVLRVLYINVSKFPRHITDVVKVIECIFQRPLDHSRQRLWSKGFLSVATMWTFAATFPADSL